MSTTVHDEMAARLLDALSGSTPSLSQAVGGPFAHVSGMHVAALCKAAAGALKRGVSSDEIIRALRSLGTSSDPGRQSGEWPLQE